MLNGSELCDAEVRWQLDGGFVDAPLLNLHALWRWSATLSLTLRKPPCLAPAASGRRWLAAKQRLRITGPRLPSFKNSRNCDRAAMKSHTGTRLSGSRDRRSDPLSHVGTLGFDIFQKQTPGVADAVAALDCPV